MLQHNDYEGIRVMRIQSDNTTFLALAKALSKNSKYEFAVTVGVWSITVTKNLEIAKQILEFFDVGFPLLVKCAGGKLFIYDNDILLNRKFLGIFGKLPNQPKANLSLSLVV